MIFSQKKRLLKDREAGLVFCWRGGQDGNRGGMLLALLLASGLFGLAFWGIGLDLKGAKPESRKAAKILLLDSISPEMALWIDQHSPFPSRWDPQLDVEHEERVTGALGALYQEVSVPVVPWREMPVMAESEVERPRLVEAGEVELGELPKVPAVGERAAVVELRVLLRGEGSLARRAPKELEPFVREIPKQWYGAVLRFAVVLDEGGGVFSCAPVEWEDTDFGKDLENWVRVQSFVPAGGVGLEVGEVSVLVEVKSHVRD